MGLTENRFSFFVLQPSTRLTWSLRIRRFSFFVLQLTLAPHLYVASARGYKFARLGGALAHLGAHLS